MSKSSSGSHLAATQRGPLPDQPSVGARSRLDGGRVLANRIFYFCLTVL
jgi:hypothetical protein